jgi:hypothetical protein
MFSTSFTKTINTKIRTITGTGFLEKNQFDSGSWNWIQDPWILDPVPVTQMRRIARRFSSGSKNQPLRDRFCVHPVLEPRLGSG